MSLIRSIDRTLYRFITRDLPREHVDRYVKHLAVADEETVVPNVIGRGLQIIDNKASGLLTHTSMMIAALGVSAPVVANDYFEQGVIVVEIMLYLLVALGCLRCLSMFQNDLDSPQRDAARDEMILRHELFKLCNRAAIGLTMLVLVSLPLLYLYVPTPGRTP
ncbi:MAG TPA: hypothetical protein VMC05_07540 [Xanthobacteraceae bacterium]|nr:hypothetical protein [Xanthobacteraceae bacterium]